ncbi:hypothetical protein SODG_002439 [Sodalis praecaptivus]
MELTGNLILGNRCPRGGGNGFYADEPSQDCPLAPEFSPPMPRMSTAPANWPSRPLTPTARCRCRPAPTFNAHRRKHPGAGGVPYHPRHAGDRSASRPH